MNTICKWCQEGNPRVPSAVSDGFVHTNTPIGRAVCEADYYIQCKWCGKPTKMKGTKMCDGCWELDHRIRGGLPLAERIIAHYKSVAS